MLRRSEKKIGATGFTILALALLLSASGARAAVSVQTAIGNGNAISADTAAVAPGTGVFTNLTGPTLVEGGKGDFARPGGADGTIIFTAPTGFEWDTTGSAPAVTVTGVGGATTLAISFNNVRNSSTITFLVTARSTGSSLPGSAAFSNFRIRPTAGTPLASGSVAITGNAGATGLSAGTITEVAGALDHLTILQQPTTTAINTAFTPNPQIQLFDQFNNLRTQDSTSTVSAVRNGGTGTLGGNTSATASSGVATFTNLTHDTVSLITVDFSTGGKTVTSGNIDVQAAALTVNITAVTTSPTNSANIVFTATFSESVADFVDAGDVIVTGAAGGTAAIQAVSGTVYTITVSGMTTDGNVSIRIPANSATGVSGGNLQADSPVIVYDTTAPTISIGAPSVAGTNTGPVTYTITYTGADTTSLDVTDITLNTTGTATGTVSVLGNVVTISGITGNGTLSISVAAGTASDTAGNTAAAAGPSATVTVDNIAPTPVISSTTTSPSSATSIVVTVDFGETVTGFGQNDLAITRDSVSQPVNGMGSVVSNFAADGMVAGRYSFTLDTTVDGAYTVDIGAAAAVDVGTNNSLAAVQFTIQIVAGTTVNITATTSSPTNSANVVFTATFSESVADFGDAGDVVVTGAAGGTAAIQAVSGTVYTITVSGMTTDGNVSIRIPGGVATGASAGPNVQADSPVVVYDTTAPTISIGAPSVSATTGGPVTFTITYGGANSVTLAANNVTLNTTGTATGTVGVTGNDVTISAITGNGTLGISIAAGTASDLAGNTAPAAGPSATVTVDNIAPKPAITSTTSGPTNASSIVVAVAFGETVTGFAADDLVIARGATSLPSTGIGSVVSNFAADGMVAGRYTFTLDTSVVGTYTIDIAAAAATDVASTNSLAADQFSIQIVAGTGVNITANTTSPTNSANVVFTATFSESVSDFGAAGDVVVTGAAGGTAAIQAVSGTVYTITVSGMTADGNVSIRIPAGAATGAVAGPSVQADSPVVVYDTTAPTISIGAPSVSTTNTGPVTYTITYGGADTVTLSANDVTLNTTGTATGTVGVASNVVTISSISGNGTLGISIAASTASDLAGNTAAAAGPSATVTVDNVAPTVSIGAPSVAATNSGPVSYTITFSGEISSDLTGLVSLNKTGDADGTVTINSNVVTISAITGDGTLGISIGGGAATDAAGNQSAAAGPSTTFTVDNTAPVPTIDLASGQNDPTTVGVINFSVVFDESVGTSFTATDVTLSGTANPTTAVVTGSGTTYNVRVTGMDGTGTVIINVGGTVTDALGNQTTTENIVDNSVDYTPARPTVTIEQAAGQADPTAASPVSFTVQFSEPVTGFDSDDVSLTGTATATVSQVTPVGADGMTYTVDVSVTADGTVIASVIDSGATSNAGEFSQASTSADNTVTVDTVPPTVTIGNPSVSATSAGPVTFTITFSGATSTDLTGLVTLNTTGNANGTISINGNVVTIASITGDGTLGISIGSGAASDDAGNQSAAAGPSNTFVVDNTPPVITGGIVPGTTTGTQGQEVTFTVSSGEAGLTYTFQFSDGTADVTNATGTVNHTFATAGTFTVTVIATDVNGVSTTTTLSYVVAAANTSNDICFGLNPIAYTTLQVGAKLKFPGTLLKDSVSLKATVNLNNGFNPLGQEVKWDIAGIRSQVTLDAKGNSPKSTTVKVSIKYKKPKTGEAFTARPGKLAISMKGQDLSALKLANVTTLNADTPKTGTASTAHVCVVLTGHQAYETDKTGIYKAKAGKTGAYKSDK